MKLTRIRHINKLILSYKEKVQSKESLLHLIDENEIPEQVYNSNAIENSTLTLPETEKILLQLQTDRHISLREAFEAKNLARVLTYIKKTAQKEPLTKDMILLLHKMLLMNIDDTIAGRFRKENEMVVVGTHIGLSPQFIDIKIQEMLNMYTSNLETPVIHKIAKLHAVFENIHPFIDGNGRIGRVISNYLLIREGLPAIIIRNKEKKNYYKALRNYDDFHTHDMMIRIFELALMESLHKRTAYLDGLEIIPLAEYARENNLSHNSLINAAHRQTVPAFRERGAWKIGTSKSNTSHSPLPE